MEIIARRKGGLFFLYGLCSLSGVFFLAFSLMNTSLENYERIGNFLIGLTLLVTGLVICVLYLRTPKVVITYDGNKLSIGGQEYKPSQITSVNYRRARAKHTHYRWGSITVKISGKEYRYSFVADVEEVHNRLIALMKEAVWDEGANAAL